MNTKVSVDNNPQHLDKKVSFRQITRLSYQLYLLCERSLKLS